MKKHWDIILFVFISFILIYSLFKPTSYQTSYTIDNYEITEEYNLENKEYIYTIKKDNQQYNFLYNDKYHLKHQLLKKIIEYSLDTTTCIVPFFLNEQLKPICLNNNEYLSYQLVDKKLQELMNIKNYEPPVLTSINNINIYNQNYNYLLWNYKEFISIKEQEKTTINLFNKDIYSITLATILNNYLLIPNYDQEYNFNEFYIINLNSMKVTKWKIKYDISYDSYILGTYDKSIYLVDKKNKIEYEIVPHRKKIRIIGTKDRQGKIYNNGFSNISLTKLTTSNLSFTYQKRLAYKLDDNYLYMDLDGIVTKISNQKVDGIIKVSNNTVYYISNSNLYSYNYLDGELLLLSNFEWNFNYQNNIFIY